MIRRVWETADGAPFLIETSETAKRLLIVAKRLEG